MLYYCLTNNSKNRLFLQIKQNCIVFGEISSHYRPKCQQKFVVLEPLIVNINISRSHLPAPPALV